MAFAISDENRENAYTLPIGNVISIDGNIDLKNLFFMRSVLIIEIIICY